MIQLFGGGGDDVLQGLDDDDFLVGEAGTDSAFGGSHVDGDTCDAETEVNCEI